MIPTELYRGIVGLLDHDSDRLTLLSVAQCCSALCEESQRVLFRSTSGEIWSERYPISRHQIFLQAVIGSPRRLALYVKEFLQNGIAWEPGHSSKIAEDHQEYEARAGVFVMTMHALPMMVNLERLAYFPYFAHPSGKGLRQCTFRLRALELGGLDIDEELLFFLFSQESLCHISVDWITGKKISSVKRILPQLVSVRGAPSTFLAFSEALYPGQIQAFDCLGTSGLVKNTISGLKYLRINNMSTLHDISHDNMLPNSVKILEVTCKVTAELDLSQYLPLALHALVLRYYEFYGYQTSQDEMGSVALSAFKKCPSLAYVDFVPVGSARGFRVRRSSFPATNLSFSIILISDQSSDWWKRHL